MYPGRGGWSCWLACWPEGSSRGVKETAALSAKYLRQLKNDYHHPPPPSIITILQHIATYFTTIITTITPTLFRGTSGDGVVVAMRSKDENEKSSRLYDDSGDGEADLGKGGGGSKIRNFI